VQPRDVITNVVAIALFVCISTFGSPYKFEAQRKACAGIFKYLREEVVLKTETPRSVDVSGECTALLEHLMLAQAQEMFFELLCVKKAESSAIKWGTLAQAAMSAAEQYTATADAYMKPVLVKHIQREWGESNKVKAIMYEAEAHFLQARPCRARNLFEMQSHTGSMRSSKVCSLL
jgi:programmed cell death 6-interacting protein